MNASELIATLQEVKAKYGDLPVVAWHSFKNEWEPVVISVYSYGVEDDAIHIEPS